MNTRYAAGPTALVIEDVNGKKGTKKVQQLLWGDQLDLQTETEGDFVRVRVRVGEGSKRIFGWMKQSDIQADPLLEVTFVDIGQGDGCLLITPDRKIIVIDAGEGDNMMRFLRWRFMFPSEKRPLKMHAAVVSHPDSDHYHGFRDIFKMPGVTFKNLYHNGLVERKGKPSLGKREGALKLYTDLIDNKTKLKKLLAADAKIKGRKQYPDMLRAALDAGKFQKFQMLSSDDTFLPGFTDQDNLTVEVLGPVVEEDGDGNRGLRDFGSDGFTKNGHSVVLRLKYNNVAMLLGGDLNIPSEKLLLRNVMGRDLPKKQDERKKFIEEARKILQVDIAKSCHHGSADFSSLFLEAVNPLATVISSGDAEPHSHPRAETLGAIGVNSRGERPLIFSTELARSAKDAIRNPRQERRDIKALHKQVLAETNKKKRALLEKKFRKQVDDIIIRTVQTYGAIYVRTDGKEVVMAQKFESNRASKQWDFYELKPDAKGQLSFTSKHAKD